MFENLLQGTLIKRYKRFFADVELADKQLVVAHCVNTGSMKSCFEPGYRAWLSQSDNPKRKLKYTLELIETPQSFVLANTSKANHIVDKLLKEQAIPELSSFEVKKKEASILDSRFDFLLENTFNKELMYLEVKSVTFSQNKTFLFPDSPSLRGQKHLKSLTKLAKDNIKSSILFLISRTDGKSFSPAKAIDPEYARLLLEAVNSGVSVFCCQVFWNGKEFVYKQMLNLEFN